MMSRPFRQRATRLAALVVFAALVALAPSAHASGEGAATFYNQGNAAFAKGDYAGAVDAYEKARNEGADDARLLYNLGCAHFRAGHLAEAIRFFEMARVRAPRDADIRFNLDYTRAQRQDELPPADQSLIIRLGRFPLERFTARELGLGAAVLFAVGFLLMGLFWARRREPRGRTVIGFGAALVFLSVVLGGYALAHRIEFHTPRGVVGADQLDIKSGPGMDNPTLFTVHAGMEYRVREVRGTWSFIEIPTGFTGWAPNEALLPVG